MKPQRGYPSAPRSATKDTFQSATHGAIEVPNPYDWLQDPESDQAKAFTAAQNAAFEEFLPNNEEKVLSAKKKFGAILMETYSQAFVAGIPKFVNDDVFLRVMGRGKPFAVTFRWPRDAFVNPAGPDSGKVQLAVEPAAFHDEGVSGSALISSGFSQGGRYWAYNEALSGSDWGVIRVKDVTSGQILPGEEIHDAKFNTKLPAGISWLGDLGFFYQCWLPAEMGKRRPQLRFHVLGQPQANDEVVFEDEANPSHTFWAQASDDFSIVILEIFAAGRANMVKIATVPLQVAVAAEQVRSEENVRLHLEFVHSISNTFTAEWEYIGSNVSEPVRFFWTNLDGGQVMAFDQRQGSLSEVVTPCPEQILKSAKLLPNGYITAVRSVDVEDRLQLYGTDGQQVADLDTPAKTIVDMSFDPESGTLLILESSFCYGPRIWAVAHCTSGAASKAYEISILPNLGAQPEARISSQRHFYRSRDGTRVPLFITKDEALQMTASTPVLLYIYGGFGISLIPHFRPEFIAWIRGFPGILATANIRGGSEYGRAWYQAACKEKRQNLFDDIIAAARYIRSDITRHDRTPVVLMGESMGALNSSVVMIQQPNLFNAVLLNAGAFDILHRREMGLQGRGGEDVGDPYDPAHFDLIRKWEPLQNLAIGQAYPAVLLTAGTRDDLVSVGHSLKMTAALQHATRDGRDSGIVSLKTIEDLGHGGNISAVQRAAVAVDRWLWAMKALNLEMRCVMTGEQPCARCVKAGRECVVQPSRRGVQKSGPSRQKNSRRDGQDHPPRSLSWNSHVSTRSWNSVDRSGPRHNLTGDASPGTATTPASSDSAPSERTRTPLDHHLSASAPRAPVPDETLHDLVGFFRAKLLYFVPVLDKDDLDDISFVVRRRRPLALAVSVVATNYVPGAAAVQNLLRPLVSDFIGSLEDALSADPELIWTQLQACAVLYAYRGMTDVTKPEMHSQEERRLNHWRMKATIEDFAMRHRLHRSLDDVRALVEQGESQVRQTYAFRKATFWLWLFTMSHHFSLATATPPTIRLDNSIRNACVLLSRVDIPSRISRMLAEVDLALLWERAEAQLPGIGEWWCAPPAEPDCEEAARVLADADNALHLWTKRWGVFGVAEPTYPGLDVSNNGAVAFHFGATRFWLHVFTARIIYQQISSTPLEPPRAEQLYADVLIRSVQAAEQFCQYFLDLPPLQRDSARHMADFGFSLLALCSIYTIRIYKVLGHAYPVLRKSVTVIELCGKLFSEMAVASNQLPLVLGKRILECLGDAEPSATRHVMEVDAGVILSQCRTDMNWIDHLYAS